MDPLANLPDFVDPDEAIVSSWSEADRAGHRLETSSSLGLPRFKDYTSQDATEGSVTWLAEVASQPQRYVAFHGFNKGFGMDVFEEHNFEMVCLVLLILP